MLKTKELVILGVSAIMMAIMISFVQNKIHPEKLILGLAFAIIILFVWMLSKLIAAHYFNVVIEQKLWLWQRYYIHEASYWKKPIPIGFILPLLLSFLSAGIIKFFAFSVFYSHALPSKVAKRYGSSKFRNVNEWDDAQISFYGVLGVMILAIIAHLIGSHFLDSSGFVELGKISLYFAVSNLIPIGYLDGTKLALGSRPLYVFAIILWIITALIVLL